jgi:hypothetical protein
MHVNLLFKVKTSQIWEGNGRSTKKVKGIIIIKKKGFEG